MTTTPDVLLFADGGRASTTAPQRSTLERDHQLQRIPVDRPHCILMNPITEAGRETATERDKLSTDSLARARAAILHLGAAADQPPKGIISARGRTHPQLPDEVGRTALLQQPAPPSSETLSYPPPAQGNHRDATLPRAPSQIQRVWPMKRGRPAARAPVPPDSSSLRTPAPAGRTCSSFKALTAPATVTSPTSWHPRRLGSAESLRPPFAYGSATAAWLQPRGLTSQLSMLKPPPH